MEKINSVPPIGPSRFPQEAGGNVESPEPNLEEPEENRAEKPQSSRKELKPGSKEALLAKQKEQALLGELARRHAAKKVVDNLKDV